MSEIPEHIMPMERAMNNPEMNEEIDMIHWRIEQVQRMLADLAVRLGHHDLADDMVRFNNQDIQPAIRRMRDKHSLTETASAMTAGKRGDDRE